MPYLFYIEHTNKHTHACTRAHASACLHRKAEYVNSSRTFSLTMVHVNGAKLTYTLLVPSSASTPRVRDKIHTAGRHANQIITYYTRCAHTHTHSTLYDYIECRMHYIVPSISGTSATTVQSFPFRTYTRHSRTDVCIESCAQSCEKLTAHSVEREKAGKQLIDRSDVDVSHRVRRFRHSPRRANPIALQTRDKHCNTNICTLNNNIIK